MDNQITIKLGVYASNVRSKIKSALSRSAQIEADEIVIAIHGGKMTLSGQVKSYHERNMAANTAWSAPGVTPVENLLVVN